MAEEPIADAATAPDLPAKEVALRALLRSFERVIVAYSGGIDSTLLLKVATEELGAAARGVLAAGPSLPQRDLDDAQQMAGLIGCRLDLVETREFEDPRYLANGPDRCYWCRSALAEALRPLAERERAVMVYGALVDDLGEDRPGMSAAERGGIRAPLLEVGLTKANVRELARGLGLPIWDKPSSACLSSRIPTGTPISADLLARVDRAERALLSLGFRVVRVRDEGTWARVELGADEVGRLAEPGLREQVIGAVRGAGFARVAVDLEGYRPAGLKAPRLPSWGG